MSATATGGTGDPVIHLFVYGTLRGGFAGDYGRDERARLHAASVVLGEGVLAGRLLDLGDYPGLLETRDAGSYVTGDVLRLQEPVAPLFTWLDEYEGLSSDGLSGEYARVVREAAVAGGTLFCWVYVLRARPADARPVASGDWLRR